MKKWFLSIGETWECLNADDHNPEERRIWREFEVQVGKWHNQTDKISRDGLKWEEINLVFCVKAGWGQELVWIQQQIIQRTEVVSLSLPRVKCEYTCRRYRFEDSGGLWQKLQRIEGWQQKNIGITWQCWIPHEADSNSLALIFSCSTQVTQT